MLAFVLLSFWLHQLHYQIFQDRIKIFPLKFVTLFCNQFCHRKVVVHIEIYTVLLLMTKHHIYCHIDPLRLLVQCNK